MSMGRDVQSRWLAAALCLLLPVGVRSAAPPAVNGRIEQHGELRIVRVWGTPQEMGFAHGFLLAEEIAVSVNDLAGFFFRDQDRYERGLRNVARFVELPAPVRAELQGMLEGMTAKLGRMPLLKSSGKPIERDDLMLVNSIDLLRAFGCSGFTVWGAQAGDAGVITTRNFDFAVIGQWPSMPDGFLVREPTGLRKVASVAPPGYIGVFTGINEDGVCLFLHDGNGPRLATTPEGRHQPMGFWLRDLAERASPEQAASLTGEAMRRLSPYPFSYLVRVIGPRTADGRPPERVFRVDAEGFGENPGGATACITTNHYLGTAAAPGENSQTRYETLRRSLDQPMTPERAWKALADVAGDEPMVTTLHSLVVYPESRRLEIAFARAGETTVPAAKRTPVKLTFDELFGPQRATEK